MHEFPKHMIVTGIILSLILSAVFSGSEIAFISSSKLRVELKKKSGTRRGLILARFFERPADFLSTMLVGNNIVLVIFTSLMTIVLTPMVQAQFGLGDDILLLLINTIIITLVVLIFGEFLPKTFFRLYSDSILYFLAYPLSFLEKILAIPSWLMFKSSKSIMGRFTNLPPDDVDDTFTRTDLEDFIKSTRTIDEEEEVDTELFEKALKLQKVRLRDCMIPRTEIVHIDYSSSLADLTDTINDTKISRILISEEDIDKIVGYVHHQQLFKNPKSLKKIILPIDFLPEAMRVRDAMDIFIKNNISIACVVDEYGGTSGLVTMEDIVEEIFGEIDDEHDQEDLVEVQVSDNEFVFSGRLEIDYLNDKYLLNFPEGEYQTLSGYVVMTSGDIPEEGSEITLGDHKFILELVSNTKIDTIRVVRMPKE